MSETDERDHSWDEDGICADCGEDIRTAYGKLIAEYDEIWDDNLALRTRLETAEGAMREAADVLLMDRKNINAVKHAAERLKLALSAPESTEALE